MRFDRLTPAEEYEVYRRISQHRKNLTLIQQGKGEYKNWKTLDNAPPKSFSMSLQKNRNAKRTQEQLFRKREIERENARLLDRMSQILHSEQLNNKLKRVGPKSVREKMRQLNSEAIRKENAQLVKRITGVRPVYKTDELKKEYKTNVKYIRNLSYFERVKKRKSVQHPSLSDSQQLGIRSRRSIYEDHLISPRTQQHQQSPKRGEGETQGDEVDLELSVEQGDSRDKTSQTRSPRPPGKTQDKRAQDSVRTQRLRKQHTKSKGKKRNQSKSPKRSNKKYSDYSVEEGLINSLSPQPENLAESPTSHDELGVTKESMQADAPITDAHKTDDNAKRDAEANPHHQKLPDSCICKRAVSVAPGRHVFVRAAWVGSRREIEFSIFEAGGNQTNTYYLSSDQVKAVAKQYAKTRAKGNIRRIVDYCISKLCLDGEQAVLTLEDESRLNGGHIMKLKPFKRAKVVIKSFKDIISHLAPSDIQLTKAMSKALHDSGIDFTRYSFRQARLEWVHEVRILKLLAEEIIADVPLSSPHPHTTTSPPSIPFHRGESKWYNFHLGATNAHSIADQEREANHIFQCVKSLLL